jgi:SAM-dependent methyltransferase
MSGIRAHEAYVSERFDLLQARFKGDVGSDDFRFRALVRRLEPLDDRRVLDLGCGKGRFTQRLRAGGAQVCGIDLSAAMLEGAQGFDRVRGSGRRLPFADSVFDAVVAVEVFEHMTAFDDVLDEVWRVLRPGGVILVIDKNAGSWNSRRPYLPNLAVKWLDERRGRWMYPSDAPVRERWFWPEALRARLARRFARVDIEHLISPSEEVSPLFRLVARARLMALWIARKPGGPDE